MFVVKNATTLKGLTKEDIIKLLSMGLKSNIEKVIIQ